LDDLTLLATDGKYCGPYPASGREKNGHNDLTMLVNEVHDADLALLADTKSGAWKSKLTKEAGRQGQPILYFVNDVLYSIIRGHLKTIPQGPYHLVSEQDAKQLLTSEVTSAPGLQF
jgi:hypothetical protein